MYNEIYQIASTIPNLPADEVPIGRDDTENKGYVGENQNILILK